MSNMSEDIQYASCDTRPPMLDRTDYESCQHCIRLYCLGKDNGKNVMKSIVEGSYQIGTMTVTLAGGVEGEHVTNFDDDVDDPPEQYLALSVDHVFESFVKPYLSKHEAEIDCTLMELKTRARDSATLYCSRVLVCGQTRAFEILQMVMA
nr:putative HVA22-like protein g [Tanacetum cinerariifolium]